MTTSAGTPASPDVSPRSWDSSSRARSNLEAAEDTFLSINSVKTYVRSTYRKIGVSTRSQAVVWGIQHGFPTERNATGSRAPATSILDRAAGELSSHIDDFPASQVRADTMDHGRAHVA